MLVDQTMCYKIFVDGRQDDINFITDMKDEPKTESGSCVPYLPLNRLVFANAIHLDRT